MTPDWATLRVSSLELLAGVAAFIAAGTLGRRRAPTEGGATLPGTHRIELRVDEDGLARVVRAPLPVTVGRAASAGVAVNDPQVSRLHARIDAVNGEISVTDLDSRNGTSVNARPIGESVILQRGDEIRVGRARIVFCGVIPWK
jgi:hypothetical protein